MLLARGLQQRDEREGEREREDFSLSKVEQIFQQIEHCQVSVKMALVYEHAI